MVAEEAFKAVGRVVYASQMFEFVFISTVKLAIKQPRVSTLEDVIPIQWRTGFKTPVIQVLNELVAKNLVGNQIADRIRIWTERRHTIIHRTVLETSWPEECNLNGTRVFVAECEGIVAEAAALTGVFCEVLKSWSCRLDKGDPIAMAADKVLEYVQGPDFQPR